MKGDRERCLAGGMDGYFSKPIQTRELDELLEIQLANRRQAGNPYAPGLTKDLRQAQDCQLSKKDLCRGTARHYGYIAIATGRSPASLLAIGNREDPERPTSYGRSCRTPSSCSAENGLHDFNSEQ
ncbi:MAG: Histidine kinase [Candidatus Angelobacter sp.]|nr:Histidine kinase [Candidatus Angelobacter sp.]